MTPAPAFRFSGDAGYGSSHAGPRLAYNGDAQRRFHSAVDLGLPCSLFVASGATRFPPVDAALVAPNAMYTLVLPSGTDAAFLRVVFTGEVTLEERREAFGAAIEAALAGETTRILIDFTEAVIAPYPVIDGVKYAWHAAQLTFLDKIAYVAPGQESDLTITLLRDALDIDVRLFGHREEAHAWLADIAEPATPESCGARGPIRVARSA